MNQPKPDPQFLENHPREVLHSEYRRIQMHLVGLLRSEICWADRKAVADAMFANELAYRRMREEINLEDARPSGFSKTAEYEV